MGFVAETPGHESTASRPLPQATPCPPDTLLPRETTPTQACFSRLRKRKTDSPILDKYEALSFCGFTPTRPRDVSRLYESIKIVRENRSSVSSRRVGGAVQCRDITGILPVLVLPSRVRWAVRKECGPESCGESSTLKIWVFGAEARTRYVAGVRK